MSEPTRRIYHTDLALLSADGSAGEKETALYVDSLAQYHREIRKSKPLTPKEELAVARRIRRGDPEALEALVVPNLRFVAYFARRYQNLGLSLEDLISEGNIGLIEAARRFDETKGFKFISYAVWWVKQAIFQALADQGKIVRLPLNRAQEIREVEEAEDRLAQKLGREPSPAEIADTLGATEPKVIDALRMRGWHLSLDGPEGVWLAEELEDGSQPDQQRALAYDSLSREIGKALSTLSEREAEVIRLYFGIDGESLTLEQIGDRLGFTRERIRQIKKRAILRLRHPSRSRALRPYVGISASTGASFSDEREGEVIRQVIRWFGIVWDEAQQEKLDGSLRASEDRQEVSKDGNAPIRAPERSPQVSTEVVNERFNKLKELLAKG